jgi:predicted Zn-dependent protease
MMSIATSARRHALLLLLMAAFLVSSCTVSKSPITGKSRAYGYSWAQEVQIGQEADPQIVAQFGLADDPQAAALVEQIGQEVLAVSHLRRPDTDPEFRNTPFTFRLLDSPVVNAFALPGGYIYVTRGLMSHLNNEAQLAVVLGHEIGHVAARHASQRAASQQLGQLGLIGAAIGGGAIFGGEAAEGILNLGSQAAQLLFLKYGRDDERESDQLGVDYAAQAGYAPSEGSPFFESLKRISEMQGGIPTFLSSHPDPGEREQTILELAQRWEQGANLAINQTAYYNAIKGMVLGTNPRQGFVRNGIFYHPELKFSFPVPSGYAVDNQTTQVAMIEQNQNAILIFTFAEANTPQEAATQFASQEGLTVVDSGRSSVAGNDAAYVLVDVQTQDGVAVRALSYYIAYGGTVYNFLGYAAQQTFNNYQDGFLRTIRGFDRVTDASILNVQPTALRVVQADRTASFRSFVPANLPDQFTAEDLAIMNQVTLDEQIQRGQLLKLPN